jgi:hypothetical protein
MGLPTWAKRKLEENWPTSLTKAIMKVEDFLDVGWGEKFGFKKDTRPLTRRHAMKGNGTKAKPLQRGKSPNNSKAQVLNPKEFFPRKGLLSKQANPREMLVGTQRNVFQLQ